MKQISLSVLGSAMVATFVATGHSATTLEWGAKTSNGLANAGGAELPVGDLVRVGTFVGLNDAQIIANQGNVSFLNSHWVDFGDGHIGDVYGIHGFFDDASTNSVSGLNIAGDQIYLWVFDSTNNSSLSSSLSTADQQGIFYLNDSSGSPNAISWRFQDDSSISPVVSPIDLSDLTTGIGNAQTVSGATIVVGSFPGGVSPETNAPNFELATIPAPEPASASMAIIGGIAVLGARRRRSI